MSPTVRPAAAAAAGAAATAVALAVGEALGALAPRVASPVVAVGDATIALVPGWLDRWAISVFGTANKAVLNVGIAAVALVLGAVLGLAARRRPAAGTLGFVAAGLVGVAAFAGATSAPLVRAVVVVAVAVASGVVALRRLLALAPVTPAGGGDRVRSTDRSRRRFLVAVAGTCAAAAIGAAVGRTALQRVVLAGVALPPPAEPVVVPAELPVPGLARFATSNRDFFRIDTSLVPPRVDPESWRLRVTGLVDREVTLALDDILAMPLVERWITVVCVSNPVGGDLVGNAAWTGVPLRDVLDLAVPRDRATQVVGRSVDGWTAGFPTDLVYDGRDALVAVGMNGEPLPRAHGAPARLVVAGLYGYVSATKWLEELELTSWDAYDAYWVRRDWAKEGPVRIASRIDVPRDGETVEAGPVDVAGVAWATRVGIGKVEVTTDGVTWQEAELGPSPSGHAWRQWRHRWEAPTGTHHLAVRATGSDGEVQTSQPRTPFPDGATGHHTVAVTVA